MYMQGAMFEVSQIANRVAVIDARQSAMKLAVPYLDLGQCDHIALADVAQAASMCGQRRKEGSGDSRTGSISQLRVAKDPETIGNMHKACPHTEQLFRAQTVFMPAQPSYPPIPSDRDRIFTSA